MIFLGRGLDIVPFVLIIDIVNDGVNSTVLMMPYSIVSNKYVFMSMNCTDSFPQSE